MVNKKLIHASAARKAILKADPKLAYLIDSIKPVDAVEVVHARWIDVRQYCGDYMCSNCKELSRTKTYNYCPGCGADMKENKLNLEDVFDIEAQTKANNDAMRKAISFMVSGAKMDGERKE